MKSANLKLHFHINSRKPFAEEAPVMAAVEHARKQLGQVRGTKLFRTASSASVNSTAIPSALEIIRNGMKSAVEQALEKGYVDGVVGGIQNGTEARLGHVAATNAAIKGRSAIHDAQIEVSNSLRRLGVGT